MARPAAPRKYGKKSTRSKAERLFTELPQSPMRSPPAVDKVSVLKCKDILVDSLVERVSKIQLHDEGKSQESQRTPTKETKPSRSSTRAVFPTPPLIEDDVNISPEGSNQEPSEEEVGERAEWEDAKPETPGTAPAIEESISKPAPAATAVSLNEAELRTLTWTDVCPPGDSIVKIAEASYAEVYRVTNERGTSIIKVIRLESPIRPQTKTQIKFGLVDEEPRSEGDVGGELQISEWLADIPGFVVYKERYVVKGKAPKHLLETHQVFQKRLKRQDPGRAQFYPSPSRYLDDTKFLVVELGDAGQALEDWKLRSESELWDIFFLEAIALARAEELAMFEVSSLDSPRPLVSCRAVIILTTV